MPMWFPHCHSVATVFSMVLGAAILSGGCAAQSAAGGDIPFTEETLENGLRVVYAPLHQAPVVHVRVLYHVGSRDESPDRQGFAHMFEHMMFRGSAHVKPQEHMKLVNTVGGMSNAFTSFDQTVYVNTLPSSHLETALYLEADRMASFKVSDEIYAIERNVVTEEWRMQQNQPYGNLFADFLKTEFTRHSYRWTPIGNMDHLRAAATPELQAFFNRYYVPNNAVLVIAGDIDVPAAREMVHKYFAWIPKSAPIERDIPAEPPQTEPRRVDVHYRAPLAQVVLGYRVPPYRSLDHDALSLLGTILGDGRASRLQRRLVTGTNPSCLNVSASDWALEDGGVFDIDATVLTGHDAGEVEKAIAATIAEIAEHGVTIEELERAKITDRIALVRERETATSIAQQLGHETLLGGDPQRVNTALARLNAVTPAQIKAAAAQYLRSDRCTTLRVTPDPHAPMAGEPTGTPSTTGVAAVAPRPAPFPEGYPQAAPMGPLAISPQFQKGVESTINGMRVIVMHDPEAARLPLVHWSLTMRRGSDCDPAGKAGLAGLTATLVRRGAGGLPFAALNERLESRGIKIEIRAGDDYTRLTGSCLSEQLDEAMQLTRTILREPTLDAQEFARIKEMRLSELKGAQDIAGTVANEDLMAALYPHSPLGTHATVASIAAITLGDAKACYQTTYSPDQAVLMLSGDVTQERGQALAAALLEGWQSKAPPPVDYTLPPAPTGRTIILVDRPAGRQGTVRMGLRAYDLGNQQKFAGALANQILSGGIEARLGQYVRAEKGLAYSVWGVFQPGRHAGNFIAATDSVIQATTDAIEAIFKVFDGMRTADVTDSELAEAKLRVAGGMVMAMQTIESQAGYRVDGILNGYPIDYYDKYPARVAEVTKEQVRQVMQQYVRTDSTGSGLVIVVVAPADQVQKQLERLGTVRVVPMPAQRQIP